MNKLTNILKLLKYMWDHSDQALKILETLHGHLPRLNQKLHQCGANGVAPVCGNQGSDSQAWFWSYKGT